MVRALALLIGLLPALAGADGVAIRLEPVPVTATAPLAQGVPLEVTQRVSTLTPWAREQVLVTLEVITPDRFASLQIDPVSLSGFEVVPLPGVREPVRTADGERTRLQVGWALFPVTAGRHVPELPPVRYRLDGAIRHVFPLQLPVLEVKPLPPYVPPTLPVGRVSVESALEPGGLLRPGHLAHWHVAVSAPAVPAAWLPPVLRVLKSDSAVRYLPAQSVLESVPDVTGVHTRAEHTIPFKPLADGPLALPALEVTYFDPASGRLERVVHRPPRPLVLGLTTRLAGAALALALVGWAAPRLWRRSRASWQRHRARRAALAALREATDAAALRAALRRLTAAEGRPANVPLTRLGGRVQGEELAQLAAASYGGRRDVDLPGLRERLLRRL